MEKDDSARMDAAEKLLKGFFFGGLVILIPVHIGQAPENGLIAQFLGLFQIAFAVFPLGWAIEFFPSPDPWSLYTAPLRRLFLS